MTLQNSDTTNRLNTLAQTKNTTPRVRAPMLSCATNAGTNASRQAMKKP